MPVGQDIFDVCSQALDNLKVMLADGAVLSEQLLSRLSATEHLSDTSAGADTVRVQSSPPSLPSWTPAGLPLDPGEGFLFGPLVWNTADYTQSRASFDEWTVSEHLSDVDCFLEDPLDDLDV